MLSGYSRKIDSNVSALTIDARKILKKNFEPQTDETENLPLSTRIITTKCFSKELGILYEVWLDSQRHNIIDIETHEISDEIKEKFPVFASYNKLKILDADTNYSLNSDFSVEEDELLMFSQNTLVLNGHTLHIKGSVFLTGRSIICNGYISIESCNISRDVFIIEKRYINNNLLFVQEPQIYFNAVNIKTIDDGSSTTFLNQNIGIPQDEESLLAQEELSGFKILYDYCFTENGPLYPYLNTIRNWNTKVGLIGLFLLRLDESKESTQEAFLNSVNIMIKNESRGEAFKSIAYKQNEDGSFGPEPSIIVKSLIDLMFEVEYKDYFKPVSELITTLKGKVAIFDNVIRFDSTGTFNMSHSIYTDNLKYNSGVADDIHIYGFHDFIADPYLNVEEKTTIVNIENCLCVTKGFTIMNHGSTFFDLNGKLTVKNTKFILYGLCEFIANNFIEDKDVKVYHTKIFEDCDIEMFKCDNFLTINGGNAIFRNCKIHFYKPVLETSRFITFRRYPKEFEKKIRVYFENCEILGNVNAGKDETFNEDYCKIVIRPSKSNSKQAELYINSDEIIKNQYGREFTDIDESSHYSNKEKKCYIRARQMNPFENGILIEE